MHSVRYLVAPHGLEVGLQRRFDKAWAEEEEELEDLHALEHEEDDEAHLYVYMRSGWVEFSRLIDSRMPARRWTGGSAQLARF